MKSCRLPDGRDFAWREYGSGRPLILIHGWGSSPAIFNPLMIRLPGYRSLAPHLPGYGASTPASAVNLDALCDDFISWFDGLDLASLTVLGWSLGGIIAQQLALRLPQRIERLVLVATTPCFVATPDWHYGLNDTSVRALARDYKRAPAVTLENFWKMQFSVHTPRPPAVLPTLDASTAIGGLELLRRTDLRSSVKEISQPTLIVHGRDDQVIPIGAGQFLAESLPCSRFHAVDNCGHVPFLSAKEEVGATLREFLA